MATQPPTERCELTGGPPHGPAPGTPRPTERRAAAAPPSRLRDRALFVIGNRGQSLFTDRDLRGPLPLIANRGQCWFTRFGRGPHHAQEFMTATST